MTRAAIYGRFSSENQDMASIHAQLRACKEYAQARGYLVVAVYTDEAESGKYDDRPGFQQMVKDAKAGRFDVVLVHKLDRFARNRYDSAIYKRELKKAGVRRESVLERLDDSPEAVILESVLEGVAEYFSLNLARETKKGLRENALQARSCGGRPPLGYDLGTTGRYIINELEAPIVRLIFSMYDVGRTYSEILAALAPYRTKRGQPFGKNSLHDLLRNEKYAGIYTYNKRDCSGEKYNGHAFRPADDWVTVEGGMPAIVDPDLWRRVQDKMDGRKAPPERARQRAKADFLLSGLIHCGICERGYIGKTSVRKTGQRWSCYVCGSRDRGRNCGNVRVSKAEAERAVLDGLHEIIFEDREGFIGRLLVLVEKRQTRSEGELERARARVHQLEGEVASLVGAVRKGQGTDSLLAELDQTEKEMKAARVDLASLEAKESPRLTRGHIEQYLDHIEQALAEETNQARLKYLVGRLVERVTVYPDRLEIEYRIDDSSADGTGGTTRTNGSPNPLPTVSVIILLPQGKRKAAHPGG